MDRMDLRLNFALEGFRLLRERPRLLAFWGMVSLFGCGICLLLLVAIAGPYYNDILAFNKKPDDMALAMKISPAIFTGLALCTPIYLVTSAILICAICRAGLGEENDRLGFLRFGLRELRVLIVQIITLFLSMLVLWASGLVLVLVGLGQQTLMMGLGFAAIAWLQLRLSLNLVQSFATNRINVFGSFQLTRGRSIPLLGGYLLAYGLSMVVWYLSLTVMKGVLVLVFGQPKNATVPDMSSLSAFLTPQEVVLYVMLFGIVWPQIMAIIHAPSVAAYRDLKA
jgi:hypothetical protein